MNGGIFLIRENGDLLRMLEKSYDSEHLLQTLLEDYPDLLAGDQIDETIPRRWLLISREAGIPDGKDATDRFAVDHLFLDQDGVPTIVEVKRSTDNRIRREVVGQMLDYAANAVIYLPVEKIRCQFTSSCAKKERDAELDLAEFLGQEVLADDFWKRVEDNLKSGRVRLVFVADDIPAELRRIVEFLNSQMDPAEVLAVEIKQFAGDDLRALVPRVIGLTANAERKKRTTPSKTNQLEFWARLEDHAKPVFERIFQLAKSESFAIKWGQSGFSLNMVYELTWIPLCFGYPSNGHQGPTISSSFGGQGCIRSKAGFAESTIDRIKAEAIESGLFNIAKGEVKYFIDSAPTEEQTAFLERWIKNTAHAVRESLDTSHVVDNSPTM